MPGENAFKQHSHQVVSDDVSIIPQEYPPNIPARSLVSASDSCICSTANLDASGVLGLFEGGVGNEAEGAVEAMRASSEGELGPSIMRWARMKHAEAMIRASKRMQSTVR